MKEISNAVCYMDNGRDFDNFLQVIKFVNGNSLKQALSHSCVYRHIFFAYPRNVAFNFLKENIKIFVEDEDFIKSFISQESRFDINMQIFVIKKLSKEQFVNHVEKNGNFKKWLAGNKEITDYINKNMQVDYLSKSKYKNYEFRKIRDTKIVKKIMTDHNEFFENNIQELRAWHEDSLSYNENHTKNNRENNQLFYSWAVKLNDEKLKESCLKYYRRQFESTLKYQDFKSLPVEEPELIDHMIEKLSWRNEDKILAFFQECIKNKEDIFVNHSSGHNRFMLLVKNCPKMMSLMSDKNFVLPEEVLNKSFIYLYENTPLLSKINPNQHFYSVFAERLKLNASDIPDNIPVEYLLGNKKGQKYLINSIIQRNNYTQPGMLNLFSQARKKFDIEKENYELHIVINLIRAYRVNKLDNLFKKMEEKELLVIAKLTDSNLLKTILKEQHLVKLQQFLLKTELSEISSNLNLKRI